MTSIQEKIDSLVNERSLLLSSKTSIEANKISAESERDFIFQYLTNSTSNPGIVDILSVIAKEIHHYDNNRNFSSPDLIAAQSAYSSALLAQMNLAVSQSADGEFYLTPTSQTINESSDWLTNNGVSAGDFDNSSIEQHIVSIKSSLVTLRSLREAVDEFSLYLQRDYYSNPEKTALEASLTALISELQYAKTNFCDVLDGYISSISSNPFLSNPDISPNVPSITGYGATLAARIEDLQDIYDYLHPIGPSTDCSFDPDYARATFDALIGFEGTGILDSDLDVLKSALLGRISTLLGSFNGDLSSGLRKWYYFWIKLMIGKPQSTLVTTTGLAAALSSTITSLASKKLQLETIFGTNYEKFLPRPSIPAVFRDEENRVNILVLSLPCFSSIDIFRKEILETDELSNNGYEVAYRISSTELPEATLSFLDESSIVANSLYSYRVKIQDRGSRIIDSYPTGSDQSLVFENPISYTIDETGTILSIGEHEFSPGQYIFISSKGTFQILSKTSSTITINRPVDSAGTLYKTNGIFAS